MLLKILTTIIATPFIALATTTLAVLGILAFAVVILWAIGLLLKDWALGPAYGGPCDPNCTGGVVGPGCGTA